MARHRLFLQFRLPPAWQPEFGGADLAYFSPFDADDIAGAMHRVLTDEAYARRVANAALKRSAMYDWANTAHETWAGLFQLAATA